MVFTCIPWFMFLMINNISSHRNTGSAKIVIIAIPKVQVFTLYTWKRNPNSYLYIGDSWWQNKSFVITMDHDEDTNCSSGDSPWILMNKQFFFRFRFIGILDLDVEHFGEILAQVMRSSPLDSTPTRINVRLDSGGEIASCKLFFLGLTPFDNRNGEKFGVYGCIIVKNCVYLE